MSSAVVQSVQALANSEQRCYWIGWPASGRPRVADNPEVLELAGCSKLRRVVPQRPPEIDRLLRS